MGLLLATASAPALAQDLTVAGLDGRAINLTSAQFAALPHVTLTQAIEGKGATWRGVPLAVVLAKVGAPQGKDLRGPELRDVVLISAQDGYAAALALAETDPMMRAEQVVVADSLDGAPLDDKAGPYRLIVEGDKRGARMVRMVTRIELHRLEASP